MLRSRHHRPQWAIKNWGKAVEAFYFDKVACDTWYNLGIADYSKEIEEYNAGGAPWVITYLFISDELQNILESFGVNNVSLAGPGAYGRTVPKEILHKIFKNPEQTIDFLEFCHMYDQNPYILGMGKDNLFAKGEVNY